MSRFRRYEIVEHAPSHYLFEKTSIFTPPKTLLLNPTFFPSSFPIVDDELDFLTLTHSPFSEFDAITDLIQIDETPFHTSTRRVTRRVGLGDIYLQALSDRVSALELGVDRLAAREEEGEKARKNKKVGERKYTWTAEIKSPEKDGVDRKYKWTAEIKDGKDEKKGGGGGGLEKSYKWTAEIKGKGREYKFQVSSGSGDGEVEDKKKKTKKKVKENGSKPVGSAGRIVEIEEPPSDHGGVVLRQVGLIVSIFIK